jgi:hypothetical protein
MPASTVEVPEAIPESRRGDLYTIFDPETDGSAGYLASRGWAAIGPKDHPNECGFLDPQRPDQDTYTTEDITCPQWVEIGTDDKGKPITRREVRPLFITEYGQDGVSGPKRTVPGRRVHFTPSVVPINLGAALMIQRDRDLAEQKANFEAARAKAARK